MRPWSTRRRPARARGLSLIETLLASAVLSFSAGAVLYAVVAGQAHYAAAESRTHAIEIADDLMNEIVSLPYLDPDGPSNPGPEANEKSRADFDNSDDYDGYVEKPDSSNKVVITDKSGKAYDARYAGFGRSVTATRTTMTNFPVPIKGLLISITVTEPKGAQWLLTRFIPEPPQ